MDYPIDKYDGTCETCIFFRERRATWEEHTCLACGGDVHELCAKCYCPEERKDAIDKQRGGVQI